MSKKYSLNRKEVNRSRGDVQDGNSLINRLTGNIFNNQSMSSRFLSRDTVVDEETAQVNLGSSQTAFYD